MESIYYKIKGLKRPSNGTYERYLLKGNKIPFIRTAKCFRKLLCNAFNMPLSTTFDKDFFSSAPNLIIGENVGLGDTFILAYASVTIGSGCSFSFRNMIITSTHDFNDFATVIAKPIIIGKNVWVTSNVTILPGVTIGDNSVIGAGSIVTHDIPSGVFAAGNPCKVIRSINFNK